MMDTSNPLFEACEKILERQKIRKFQTERGLYWNISGELDEDYGESFEQSIDGRHRRIFGIPVYTEWLMGENTVALMESLDFQIVETSNLAEKSEKFNSEIFRPIGHDGPMPDDGEPVH